MACTAVNEAVRRQDRDFRARRAGWAGAYRVLRFARPAVDRACRRRTTSGLPCGVFREHLSAIPGSTRPGVSPFAAKTPREPGSFPASAVLRACSLTLRPSGRSGTRVAPHSHQGKGSCGARLFPHRHGPACPVRLSRQGAGIGGPDKPGHDDARATPRSNFSPAAPYPDSHEDTPGHDDRAATGSDGRHAFVPALVAAAPARAFAGAGG